MTDELNEFMARDREKRKWRRETNKAERASKEAANANLLRAAKAVVSSWTKKDLANKVRELDDAIYRYEEVNR